MPSGTQGQPSGQYTHEVKGFKFTRTPDGVRIQDQSGGELLEISERQWQQLNEKLGVSIQMQSYQELQSKVSS